MPTHDEDDIPWAPSLGVLERFEESLSALETENRELKSQSRELQKEVDTYRRHVRNLQSSRSWRLTRPLRWARGTARHLHVRLMGTAKGVHASTQKPVSAVAPTNTTGDNRKTGDAPRVAVQERPWTGDGRPFDFSLRLLRNKEALSFLLLGLTYSQRRFDEVIEMLEDFLLPPPTESRVGDLSLRDALVQSVAEAMEAAGNPDVRIGLTGGLDSRLLYGALRQVYEADRIVPYTFGYPGQYDYEFVRQYGKRFLTNHVFVETKEIQWDVDAEVRKRRRLGNPGTYNSKSSLNKILSLKGAPEHNVHGFMGDPLTGATKPNAGAAIESWDDAVNRFLKKNDRFNLQNYFLGVVDLPRLLPQTPKKSVANLDYYELLDYGIRQFQRILRDAGTSATTITPYTNRKWINALVGLGGTGTREKAYYEFVLSEFPTYFPELTKSRITSRAEHVAFREQVMSDSITRLSSMKNDSGSPFVPQVLSERGKVLAGRQFCEYAEYHNSPSFKLFFDELYNGLLDRGLISQRLLGDIRKRFLAGSKTGAEQMKGLMSFELNLRAGVLEV